MKKIALLLLLASLKLVSFAQNKSAILQSKTNMQQPAKAEVATTDLPNPIKNVITTKYNEWKLMAANVYNSAPEYYELELKKSNETILVKIDAKGTEL